MERKPELNKDNDIVACTNGDRHNLMPDESFWTEDAKQELEEYIESQGIYIRQ